MADEPRQAFLDRVCGLLAVCEAEGVRDQTEELRGVLPRLLDLEEAVANGFADRIMALLKPPSKTTRLNLSMVSAGAITKPPGITLNTASLRLHQPMSTQLRNDGPPPRSLGID